MDYWPDVIQVIPTPEHKVYIYFDDGTVRLFDASEQVKKGIFKPLTDANLFMETCTVLNHTLAWTLDKSYSPETCLDLDAFVLYENCPIVEEPTEYFENGGKWL
jgi:hypothetical protein